jgi:hypothetical protein
LAFAIRRKSDRVLRRWQKTQSAAQLSGELEPPSPKDVIEFDPLKRSSITNQ